MKRWTAESDKRAVAVIGVACRLPGASSPTELWQLLRDGVDATSETPAERYDVDALHSPERRSGRIASRRAGYLDDMAEFDAEFFGITPAEAVQLDPQQRQLLMTAWDALEDAGQIPSQLAGSRTGVYVGNTRADYLERQFREGLDSVTAGFYQSFRPMLPARLSHTFDFRGPSVLVDTACSSSLVAVHQAVQSLRSGETPLALAAGANLPMRPDEGVMMTQAGTCASDGRSKFGDADADGFAPSDGIGVVVLKRLADAVADGDRIRGVIQGSAIGNNGRTSDTLLNPSEQGHTDVLRWAYEDAGMAPSDVDFIEAHGPGALTHDAAELNALGRVVAEGRPPGPPVLVGSVKSNTGHMEAAGGLASLIKALLCLEHGEVPASLHHGTPNPLVDWDDLPLAIPTSHQALPERDRPLIAGVTGQGVSTLNAHLVLRQAEPAVRRNMPASRSFWRRKDTCPLPLSAASPAALAELVENYRTHLAPDGPGRRYPVRDICYSAAARRHHHEHRLVVEGATHQELLDELTRAQERTDTPPPLASHAGFAEIYRQGGDVDWLQLFGRKGRFVPLPRYPWQTKRYWLGEEPDERNSEDLAAAVLQTHARASRSEYSDTALLSDIGIDSLARLQIIVSLARDYSYEVEPEELAELRTVGDFREWIHVLEGQAA